MKLPKRGRPPLGRKAMTAAERQARRRERLREAENARRREQGQPLAHRPSQPPHGYGRAKEQLIAEGHHFERARREFGFEEGTFVDGAYLGSSDVIDLAALPLEERQQRLAEARHATKDFACGAVEQYMAALHVSRDELIESRQRRDELERRQREHAARR
jgi:hypothetical protein